MNPTLATHLLFQKSVHKPVARGLHFRHKLRRRYRHAVGFIVSGNIGWYEARVREAARG